MDDQESQKWLIEPEEGFGENDPLLAHLVLAVNEGKLETQTVWFCITGSVMAGRLVTHDQGFQALIGRTFDEEMPKGDKPRKLPEYAYLMGVKILHGNLTINAPAIRVKLSLVAAWGFGWMT